MYRAGIIISSDKASSGERPDSTIPVIESILHKFGISVAEKIITPDEEDLLYNAIIKLCDDVNCDIVFTSGGTGFSKRDVTPEATARALTRQAEGISRAITFFSLQKTSNAMLSRGISGIRNNSLIINLPGSPKAVSEILEYIMKSVLHGLDVLNNNTAECAGSQNLQVPNL